MLAPYQLNNPRVEWRKREDFVRRPYRVRNEAAQQADGYEQLEAVRLVKRIRTEPFANVSISETSSSSLGSTSSAFTSPSLAILPTDAPQQEGPVLAALASPPQVAPSTPPPSETSNLQQVPPTEGPLDLSAENPVDTTLSSPTPLPDSTSPPSTTTSNSSQTTLSLSSTVVVEEPSASMSNPPESAPAAPRRVGNIELTEAPLPPSLTTGTPTPSQLIVNKNVEDDIDGFSGIAFVSTASASPAANSVLLDSATGTTPVPSGISLSTFTPITQLPGQQTTASPTSSTSSSRRGTSCTSPHASTTPTRVSAEESAAIETRRARGIIAGSIVGAAAGVALLFLLIFFCYRRRKSRRVPSPPSVTPKRISPYGRFSFHHLSNRISSAAFFGGGGSRSAVSSLSEKPPPIPPAPLASRSQSVESLPKTPFFNEARSANNSNNASHSRLPSQPAFNLPEQYSTNGALGIASSTFRAQSPAIDSSQRTRDTIFPGPSRGSFVPPPSNNSASERNQLPSVGTSMERFQEPLPQTQESNEATSSGSAHALAARVAMANENNHTRHSSNSSHTIPLPPAYPQYGLSGHEPESAKWQPDQPWRDSMWSVGVTPAGTTPRGSGGWWGRSSNAPALPTSNLAYGNGYGTTGGFADYRASKSSSHYTEGTEWRETGMWSSSGIGIATSAMTPGSTANANPFTASNHVVSQMVPTVPKIPAHINTQSGNVTRAGASSPLGTTSTVAAQRPTAAQRPGMVGHTRRKSSVGPPVWIQDPGLQDDRKESTTSSGTSSTAIPNVRESGNSVATVFKAHPGTPVRF